MTTPYEVKLVRKLPDGTQSWEIYRQVSGRGVQPARFILLRGTNRPGVRCSWCGEDITNPHGHSVSRCVDRAHQGALALDELPAVVRRAFETSGSGTVVLDREVAERAEVAEREVVGAGSRS